jgi:hypothetical protein
MKYCPKCDELIPLDAVYCQYCGVNTQNPDGDPRSLDHDSETVSNAQKVKQADRFAPTPFGHVLICLFLLLISFWGLSISLTVLPLFIDPGYGDYLLHIAIATQVLFRIMIAFLAIDGRYFERKGTIEGKIATVLLSFIPLGALYSFLYAARSLSRRRFISTLSSSAVGSVALSAVLITSTYTPLTRMVKDIDAVPLPTAAVETPVADHENNPNTPVSGTIAPPSIPTVEFVNPQIDNLTSSCLSPDEVSVEDEGKTIEVCGRVTNYGELECKDCSYDDPSYILLDGTFQIISYDWHFTFAWLGDCLKVSDTVEVFEEKPVFYFSRGEGYTGTECYTDSQGELICEKGGYFQNFTGCEPDE